MCPHQNTSNGLRPSNLVCKSPRETKWNPSTWVLCLQMLHSVCLCSSRDLSEPDMKMEIERAADGHNFSSVWPGLVTQWDGLLQKQMALGSVPSMPRVCTHIHKVKSNMDKGPYKTGISKPYALLSIDYSVPEDIESKRSLLWVRSVSLQAPD